MTVEHLVLNRRYQVIEESPSYYVVRPVGRPWVVEVIQKTMASVCEEEPVSSG